MLKDFRNKIFNQDVLEVLKQLPDNCLDVIYGDPDYNVGINYHGSKFTKTWNDYIDWYIEINKECYRVLKHTGSIFMINYPKQNAHLRVKYLDDNVHDVQDYVWIYNTNFGLSKKRFTTAHRSILHIRKSSNNNFYPEHIAQPYKTPKFETERLNGNPKFPGCMPYSWIYQNLVKNISNDKTIHPCQIPRPLAELLIKSSSQPNDDVFILFGGSGGEILSCIELKRNYISCEINLEYYNMILNRLNNNGIIDNQYRLENFKRKENAK